MNTPLESRSERVPTLDVRPTVERIDSIAPSQSEIEKRGIVRMPVEEFAALCRIARERIAALSEITPAQDAVSIPRGLAEHLYSTSLEAGGRCHRCAEFRALVAARWPSERAEKV